MCEDTRVNSSAIYVYVHYCKPLKISFVPDTDTTVLLAKEKINSHFLFPNTSITLT